VSGLESILELTDQVEALIAEGNWSEASDCEARRRDLLVQYVAESGKAAQGLRELYDRSRRSIGEVSRQRREMSDDASSLMSKSKAVDAYLENAGRGAARGGA
jgi:hypothetical protein